MNIITRDLGLQDYQTTWQAMQDFIAGRDPTTPDEIWLVQHPSVYTLSQSADPQHILSQTNIPIVKTDRGGQVTYHGPGQLIAYTLIDLKQRKLGVRALVTKLETAVIQLLQSWNITAHAHQDAPGVYVHNAKICSLGLRIRRGYSYHGLSLNVDMDLAPFKQINPCGQIGLVMTQLRNLGAPTCMHTVQALLVEYLLKQFEI